MKRWTWTALALAAALAMPAFAGEKGSCKESTQTCLNEMAANLKSRGWLGIEMDTDKGSDKMTVTKVIAGSPAEAAGFKVGDVLVSVNGAKFAENTEEKCVTCEKTKANWVPGAKAQYVVKRYDKDVTLNATLGALPPDVLAQWVGMHMLEHAQPVEVAKK